MEQPLTKVARSIVELTAQGYSRTSLAEELGLPPSTLFWMIHKDPALNDAIEHAAEFAATKSLEELRDIPSNESIEVPRAKVMIEGIRAYLELRFPSRFGKRMELTVHKGLDMQSALDQARKRAGLIDKDQAQDVEYQDVSAEMATDSLSVAAAGIDDLL